jgi:O-succinylbenzoic acid--CoA ligase
VQAGGTLYYAELDRWVTAASESLKRRGVGEGTRVALYLPKDERYFVLILAILRLGAVACPMSTRLPPYGSVPLLRDTRCRVVISEDDELLDLIRAEVAGLRPVELLADRGPDAGPGEPLYLSTERPATVVFTSGSTDRPKGALHTLGNHLYNALGSNANITLAPGDRWLHALPLYHVGGLSVVFRCLLARAAIAVPELGVSSGEAIAGLEATHVSLVATQLRRLLDEDAPLGGLKAILMGGSGMPPSLIRTAVKRGLPIHTSYGLTEMASQVTATHPGAPLENLLTSGYVLPYREVSISPEDEVLVRGETLFAGYLDGDEVRLPVDREGWFHTGDLGAFDGEGRLLARGRRDNMFVSGGENVQPEEVEAALGAVDGVSTSVVVPVPDAEFGARPVAFVRVDGAFSPEKLADALEARLSKFMVPVAFHPWPEDLVDGMKPDRRAFEGRAGELSAKRPL